MASKVFSNPKAFAEFYDEQIIISGERPNDRTIAFPLLACVLDAGDDENLSDDLQTNTTRQSYTISFPISAWQDSTPPQVGDVIQIETSPETVREVYVNTIAKTSDGCYTLTARE